MLRERFRWLSLVGVLVLAAGTGGQAHSPRHHTFSGFIADSTVLSAGSWVIHGVWSADTKDGKDGSPDTADFSAALTMERSDYWLLTTSGADADNPATRNAHTHHIALAGATVTPIAGGIRITGPATITANGGVAPFGTSSTLQIDITGSTIVTFSNVKLTFGGDAVTHFGSQALAGVVRRAD
jgi:hypothetical protein